MLSNILEAEHIVECLVDLVADLLDLHLLGQQILLNLDHNSVHRAVDPNPAGSVYHLCHIWI